MIEIKSSVISKKTAVVATHENYDSAISSLIVQVICCVWLPVLGRSNTWPIKKKKMCLVLVDCGVVSLML